ncbi:hypothetical protein ACLBWZ_17310 [Brucellaceae bacterium C25G]
MSINLGYTRLLIEAVQAFCTDHELLPLLEAMAIELFSEYLAADLHS